VTSARKIKANRENARASTGPKTMHGRASSAGNALRHALSLPVCSDPVLSEAVEALTREIAGADADTESLDLARRVAEAQIDLRRVRDARHRLLSQAWNNPYYDSLDNAREKLGVLSLLLRPNAGEVPIALLENYVTTTPEGPRKLALILSQEVGRLSRLDRYERRALSRRKFAIRAFDSAKRRRAQTSM
jgi:hypothetical protein